MQWVTNGGYFSTRDQIKTTDSSDVWHTSSFVMFFNVCETLMWTTIFFHFRGRDQDTVILYYLPLGVCVRVLRQSNKTKYKKKQSNSTPTKSSSTTYNDVQCWGSWTKSQITYQNSGHLPSWKTDGNQHLFPLRFSVFPNHYFPSMKLVSNRQRFVLVQWWPPLTTLASPLFDSRTTILPFSWLYPQNSIILC